MAATIVISSIEHSPTRPLLWIPSFESFIGHLLSSPGSVHKANRIQPIVRSIRNLFENMASSASHPRRRPQKATGPSTPQLPSSSPMSLRKSETFNARTSTSSDLVTPFEVAARMPKRSPTNPKSLEALLAEGERLNAHQQHVAKLLKDFDAAVLGRKPAAGDASILNDNEVLAVPTFMVNQVTVPEPMDIDQKPVVAEHHHASDSGIGTSIASGMFPVGGLDLWWLGTNNTLIEHHATTRSSTRGSSRSSIATSHTAVTKSASDTTQIRPEHFLSEEAVRHIKKQIVQPILKEESLKEFHPLIEDIPRRIGAKYISNLRDLEKTLFFLAPVSTGVLVLFACALAYCLRHAKDFTSDHKAFLKFCETSIQCLQTTVDLLSERDQRRPTDPAYTNGYFCDLVEQIRRYAEIMARTREKEAAGQELDEMDYSPYVPLSFSASYSSYCIWLLIVCLTHNIFLSHGASHLLFDACFFHFRSNMYTNFFLRDEEITIEGGLSKNGKPAELVRKKNGKVIPLSDKSTLDDDAVMTLKRPLTDDEDEDEVYRSMARRRKSDRPGDIMYPCRVCDKEFKRPCDLTKHEKTHSRPWKCPEAKCRYHEMGWPTEKERDRHVNDKHSAAPNMYKCKFPPCTYASKRESNCKQHMEKAHGWEYVRSKSNGRKKSTIGSSNRTPATPLTPFMTTPSSENHLPTPETPFEPSPMMQSEMDFGGFNFTSNYGSSSITPAPTADELYAWDGDRRGSTTTAVTATTYSTGFSPDQANISSFDDAISPNDVNFPPSMLDTTNNFNFGFTSAPIQQPTPALSAGQNFDISPLSTHAVAAPSTLPHLSPNGQGDLTLYSPHMDMGLDEGLGGDMNMNFGGDFTLFGTDHNDFTAATTGSNWFADTGINTFGDFDAHNFDNGMGNTTDPFLEQY